MLISWIKEEKDVYLYFDTDQAGYTAFNALEIKKMIGPAYQK